MALTCARCGAQNPDGNLYCQACGTALPAAGAVATAPPPPAPPAGAFAGPPPGIAPPVVAAGGYQSPFYTPPAVPGAVHRTPWMLIIAAVLLLTVLMAGFGTAMAILGNGNASGTCGSRVRRRDMTTRG